MINDLSKFLFVFFLPCLLAAEQIKFEIAGEVGILMNADTGDILFEKEPHRLIYPASTTKIASTLFALKLKGNNLDEVVIAEQEALGSISHEAKRKAGYKKPAYWLEPDGTHIGIKKGEEFKYRDLMAAALIASANDASNVIALSISKSIPLYMEHLNIYLKSIGCLNTHYENPHGLHVPDHQTTAYDLAIMAREALKEPFIREQVRQTKFIRPKTNLQAPITYLQGNQLVRNGKYHYPKAIGIKTGYHHKSRHCLVAAATSDDRTLIAVLLGYAERKRMFEEAKLLFEAAFNQPKVRRIYLKQGPQTFSKNIEKGNKPLLTYLSEDFSLEFYPAESPEVKSQLIWRKPFSLPIRKNQVVADLQLVTPKGVILKRGELLAQDNVDLTWPHSWIRKFFQFFQNSPLLAVFMLAIVVLSLVISVWKVIRSV